MKFKARIWKQGKYKLIRIPESQADFVPNKVKNVYVALRWEGDGE